MNDSTNLLAMRPTFQRLFLAILWNLSANPQEVLMVGLTITSSLTGVLLTKQHRHLQ